MKIEIKNTFWDGIDGTQDADENNLVHSCFVSVINGLLTIYINTIDSYCKIGSIATSIDRSSLQFEIVKDHQWQGTYITVVSLIGETPEQREMLMGNRFEQHCGDQHIYKLLPWDYADRSETVLASYKNFDWMVRENVYL